MAMMSGNIERLGDEVHCPITDGIMDVGKGPISGDDNHCGITPQFPEFLQHIHPRKPRHFYIEGDEVNFFLLNMVESHLSRWRPSRHHKKV